MSQIIERVPLTHPAVSIICTAGPSIFRVDPSTGEVEHTLFRDLIKAGMGAVRINFSHVRPESYFQIKSLIKHIRDLEVELRTPVPILMDLKGPELRIVSILATGAVTEDAEGSTPESIVVRRGDRIELSIPGGDSPPLSNDVVARLTIDFEGDFYSQVGSGNTIVIGDNEVYLKAETSVASGIVCTIENPGTVRSGKGLNLPDRKRLEAPTLVEADLRALDEGFDVDLIAQSFVQGRSDVSKLSGRLAGGPLEGTPILAKIETPAAVKKIDDILQTEEVFGIMVARGDLGVLSDFRTIPQLQQRLIDAANKLGKPVVVATQMLESMVERPKPWRPEVQDIATAIREGADALMLSEETAVGGFPTETVEVMAEVIEVNVPVNREEYLAKFKGDFALPNPRRPIDVIGFAICEMAYEARAPCILSYATSGISATLISRFRPEKPIVAITNRESTARKLCLLYNVYPVLVDGELPREPREFTEFLRGIAAELGVAPQPGASGVFLVGTEEIRTLLRPAQGGSGPRARGIFVFEA